MRMFLGQQNWHAKFQETHLSVLGSRQPVNRWRRSSVVFQAHQRCSCWRVGEGITLDSQNRQHKLRSSLSRGQSRGRLGGELVTDSLPADLTAAATGEGKPKPVKLKKAGETSLRITSGIFLAALASLTIYAGGFLFTGILCTPISVCKNRC